MPDNTKKYHGLPCGKRESQPHKILKRINLQTQNLPQCACKWLIAIDFSMIVIPVVEGSSPISHPTFWKPNADKHLRVVGVFPSPTSLIQLLLRSCLWASLPPADSRPLRRLLFPARRAAVMASYRQKDENQMLFADQGRFHRPSGRFAVVRTPRGVYG